MRPNEARRYIHISDKNKFRATMEFDMIDCIVFAFTTLNRQLLAPVPYVGRTRSQPPKAGCTARSSFIEHTASSFLLAPLWLLSEFVDRRNGR